MINNLKNLRQTLLGIGLPSYVEKRPKTWEVHVSLNLVERELQNKKRDTTTKSTENPNTLRER